MPRPSRSRLYGSAIQHVLVLQEEELVEAEGRITASASPSTEVTTSPKVASPPVQEAEVVAKTGKRTREVYPWRISNRMRTVNGALVMCMNIGVDPPDVEKPNPCARMECWVDPYAESPAKILSSVGSELKKQYEFWQTKARYKICADPTATELKRICVNLRRAAKEERVLFHYNGHGVPKPTPNGEIWVFNQNYTQYIPLNLYDLRDVLGSPSVLVFDCNSAGTICKHFEKLIAQIERDYQQQQSDGSAKPGKGKPLHRSSIFLGACQEHELLPTNPRLPADLFTCCLTTPIKTLLRWFLKRTLISGITIEMIDRIPGNLSLRQTPLGEINWIFTAVTDAIAWDVLSRGQFKKLYRQDLLLASLMRNFLLAHRIMRSYGCRPISLPDMPETHTHPLWQNLDLAVENLFSQLPKLIAAEDEKLKSANVNVEEAEEAGYTAQNGVSNGVSGTVPVVVPGGITNGVPGSFTGHILGHPQQRKAVALNRKKENIPTAGKPPTGRPHENGELPIDDMFTTDGGLEGLYNGSKFFEDQMKSFDVWLNMGPENRGPPEQLPIMLQALMSPHYRVTVLPLLARYMQTGAVAVDLVLSVGMFPYIQQLLQSQSTELRNDLIFIWSKILALDDTCRDDLVKEKGEEFFIRFLTQSYGRNNPPPKPVYFAVAMFVLSVVAKGYANRLCDVGTLGACIPYLTHEDQFVRRWACLCLAEVIQYASPPIQSRVLKLKKVLRLLRKCASQDTAPDVRAAATTALSAIMAGVLRLLSLKKEVDHSSHPPRNDYQPSNQLSTEEGSHSFEKGRSHMSTRTYPHVSPVTNESRIQDDLADEHSLEMALENGLSLSELQDAPVPKFSVDERDVLLDIGSIVADIGRGESSVLVRREVAIAIAKAVLYQHERFVRAAICTDILGIDDSKETVVYADVDRCERVYRKLWTTLSELAFDPHPIVAALARRRYDMISEALLKRGGPLRDSTQGSSIGDISPKHHVFSPPRTVANNGFLSPDTMGFKKSGKTAQQSGETSSLQGEKANTEIQSQEPIRQEASTHHKLKPPPQNGSSINACPTGVNCPGSSSRVRGGFGKLAGFADRSRSSGMLRGPYTNWLTERQVPTGSIHVRSTSGSFDLNVSSRLPYMSAMPRVNSASLIPPVPDSSFNGISAGLSTRKVTSSCSLDKISEEAEIAEPRSLPKIALAKGVGMLVKTFTDQLKLTGIGSGSNSLSRSFSSNSSGEAKEEKEEPEIKPMSPPRPPKRSLSYQVLNAASSLSPGGEIPIAASSRPTYFASAGMDASDNSLKTMFEKLPQGYERLYLSGHGDAALSLYEWSSAYIARVEFDASATDSVNEEETIPRYAALWDKFIKTSGNIPSESLRAFALLADGTDGMGVGSVMTDDDNGDNFKFTKISSYSMGAGGGAVTAMAFLPRDIGMGDDQLVATGDSNGSVGVYDTRTGNCQGSFGIPFPPGIPEVGVSSILCLNRPSPASLETSISVGNSRSALILAGAYDGRVAVFKSDLQGSKYRIMSTFQASGQSYWSKVGTSREPDQKPAQHNMMNGTQLSPQSSGSFVSPPFTFSDTVRDSGNGLVLAFDSDSSYLAAGGCDSENVRVWDLSREQCIWEGGVVPTGTWPTAVTMWGRINPKVFVLGSSNGQICVVDMRERARFAKASDPLVSVGKLVDPIISLGTCPPVGRYSGEVVVSATVGGEIVFWDARWNQSTGIVPSANLDPELSRIKAHRSNLTSMAVHPRGTLIASGSTARCVKVFGPNRNMLKMLCSHETRHELSDMDNRIPPVTSLSFQPESNLLAIGAVDSTVMIYGQPDSFPGVQAHSDQVTQAEKTALYEYWR